MNKDTTISTLNIKYRNEQWLVHMYCVEELSVAEIARRCEVTSTTIINWMNRFGIPRRAQGRPKLRTKSQGTFKSWIRHLHSAGTTVADIATRHGKSEAEVEEWLAVEA